MGRRTRTAWLVLLVIVVAAVVIVALLVAGGSSRSAGPSHAPAGTIAAGAGSQAAVTPTASVTQPTPPAAPALSATATLGEPGSLSALIAELPVRPERRQGYDRDLFIHWIDADGDGCNTRYEVLIDEAVVPPTVGAGCRLSGGRWRSAYDGAETTDPSELDIDHVVALAEAWDSGAYAWSPERREAFANDLGVPWALAAVTRESNQAKSDLDPADWMPPLDGEGCAFVTDWVAVKVRWSLAVDRTEQRALLERAAACGAVPVPSVPLP